MNAASNGPPQDWLVCPFRVISSDLVRDACTRIFGLTGQAMQPIPVTILKNPAELHRFKQEVKRRGSGFVFFQAKLGGEISVLATPQSPEMSFDVTLVEILAEGDGFKIGRYGIFEIQTMDFHGSYRKAVKNLMDARRLHRAEFAAVLRKNMQWSSENVEGPNIANAFKRTFYQILLKFQLSGKGAAAGTVLALPEAVWDSWQPFLGAPELEKADDGLHKLRMTDKVSEPPGATNALICVFDLVSSAATPISPVQIKMHVRVTAEQLSHHAFKVVPNGMLRSISEKDSILTRIRSRMAEWWPEVVAVP